jgi:hypothetical protein
MNSNIIKKSKKNKNDKKNTLCISEKYIGRKDKITSFFLSDEYVPMTMKEIAGILNIQKQDMNVLRDILRQLCDSRNDNFR